MPATVSYLEEPLKGGIAISFSNGYPVNPAHVINMTPSTTDTTTTVVPQ